MITHPARYLLRIDDLCATISRPRWQLFRSLIEEFALKPILAVVPSNHDPSLEVSPPDQDFWHQMRALESAGATIGLHGYRHLCVFRGRSMLGLHPLSEFAGVAADIQRAWIADGLRTLRAHGLSPRIFVAPRHGFDRRTLAALRAEGIPFLSDGFARRPFLRRGVTWIPQQLWGPVAKTTGLWTICTHPNTTTDSEIVSLRTFLGAHASQVTSLDRALAEFPPAPFTLAERFHAEWALARVRASRTLRRSLRLARLSSKSS